MGRDGQRRVQPPDAFVALEVGESHHAAEGQPAVPLGDHVQAGDGLEVDEGVRRLWMHPFLDEAEQVGAAGHGAGPRRRPR